MEETKTALEAALERNPQIKYNHPPPPNSKEERDKLLEELCRKEMHSKMQRISSNFGYVDLSGSKKNGLFKGIIERHKQRMKQ